ncbi:MAG: phospholipid carrier-dependent glycosyltransferase [Candidatus Acidiferrales bacterium]
MSELSRFRERVNVAAPSAAGLIILVCLFGHLGAIGLVGPDEPRYAWIARAMAATGDWVTPRLYGQPWFEKPVLYYWMAGAGFLLHLGAEWASRLPSAIAAIAASFAIGWLGWKHYGVSEEPFASPYLLAPLIFSTSVAAVGFSRAAGPDMLFSAALALAMATAAWVLRESGVLRSTDGDARGDASMVGSGAVGSGAGYLALALFGAWIGIAMLAKGPAGVVLAGGAIGIWACGTRRWRDAIRLAHPVAIATFCVVALPWYVLCAIRNPDFLHIFIFQHNFERYFTPMFQHRQPVWYFGPILILGLLPWAVCLWPAAEEGLRIWREKSWDGSAGFFFACWAIFPFLFFSISQSKLPGYILPAVPPIALLMAIALNRRVLSAVPHASPGSSARWTLGAIGVTWIAMALSAARWMSRLQTPAREVSGRAILLGVIIGLVGGIAVALLGMLRNRGALLVAMFLVAVFVEIAGARVLPALDPYLSARYHGNLLRNDRYPNRVFTFHLARSWVYGLDFYLEREIPEWSPADTGAALVLTTPRGLEEIRKLSRVQGALDEPYAGILYVPVMPAAR